MTLPRKGQHRDLRELARLSFDAFWEAERLEEGLRVTTYPLRDLSQEIGLPPGQLDPFTEEAWFSGIHPDDRPHYLEAVSRAVESNGDFIVEYRSTHTNGSWVWWEDSGRPVEFEGNKAIRWIGAVRNVTERRRHEEDLHKALEQLQALKSQLESEVNILRDEIGSTRKGFPLVGRSDAHRQILRQISLVAETESTALLTGETGTGKSLVAREIHRRSSRSHRPMVTVNCAALPSSLIESEIFGHERGAFTGATSTRPGRFEVADGGTLFLDEIGELPVDVQAKLLRVLETGEFERLGSNRARKAQVRLIAATNRDLLALTHKGRFRSDLYYRLNVFPITVPPLRDRREDIALLAAYIMEKKCNALGRALPRLDDAQLRKLAEYDWPGNVRELENVLERAIILSRGPQVSIELGLPMASGHSPGGQHTTSDCGARMRSLDEIERAHILTVCESTNWKIKGTDGAAAALGLTPGTLYFRMKKHGITRPK